MWDLDQMLLVTKEECGTFNYSAAEHRQTVYGLLVCLSALVSPMAIDQNFALITPWDFLLLGDAA